MQLVTIGATVHRIRSLQDGFQEMEILDSSGVLQVYAHPCYRSNTKDSMYSQCYIMGVEVSTSTMTLVKTHAIWSETTAFLYPFAAVNSNGELALAFVYGNSNSYPASAICTYDSTAQLWTFYTTIAGNAGINTQRFGDYLRIRSHYISQTKTPQFIATGFAIQGGQCQDSAPCSFVQPIAVLFSFSSTQLTTGLITTGASAICSTTLIGEYGRYSFTH